MAWDPVILGIGVADLRKEMNTRLKKARDAGEPAAKTAKVLVKGAKEVSVTISGLKKDEAKALWDGHLKAGVKALGGKVKAP